MYVIARFTNVSKSAYTFSVEQAMFYLVLSHGSYHSLSSVQYLMMASRLCLGGVDRLNSSMQEPAKRVSHC